MLFPFVSRKPVKEMASESCNVTADTIYFGASCFPFLGKKRTKRTVEWRQSSSECESSHGGCLRSIRCLCMAELLHSSEGRNVINKMFMLENLYKI